MLEFLYFFSVETVGISFQASGSVMVDCNLIMRHPRMCSGSVQHLRGIQPSKLASLYSSELVSFLYRTSYSLYLDVCFICIYLPEACYLGTG